MSVSLLASFQFLIEMVVSAAWVQLQEGLWMYGSQKFPHTGCLRVATGLVGSLGASLNEPALTGSGWGCLTHRDTRNVTRI